MRQSTRLILCAISILGMSAVAAAESISSAVIGNAWLLRESARESIRRGQELQNPQNPELRKPSPKTNSEAPIVSPAEADNGGHGIGNGEFEGFGYGISYEPEQKEKKGMSDVDAANGGHGVGNTGSNSPEIKISPGFEVCLKGEELYIECHCDFHDEAHTKPVLIAAKSVDTCDQACEDENLGESTDEVNFIGSLEVACSLSESSVSQKKILCDDGAIPFGAVQKYENTHGDNSTSGRNCCQVSLWQDCTSAYYD